MDGFLFQLADVNMSPIDSDVEVSNIELLLGQLCINRVAGIAYQNMFKLSKFYTPKDFRNTLRAIWENNVETNKRYMDNLLYLADIFQNAKCQMAFLKGVFLITKVYEKGYRTSNDYDILVQEKDLQELQSILLENGFVQGRVKMGGGISPANRREIILSRMNYGETVPFVKEMQGYPVVVDLNISVDFKPEGEKKIVEKLLEDNVFVEIEGRKVSVLNICDFIIHLCCHLYKEATTMYWVKNRRDLLLYKFSDINVVLHKYLDKTLREALVKKIFSYGVVQECYYSFLNSSLIFNGLTKMQEFNYLLCEICPKDLDFMKKIYDPKQDKVYSYNKDFVSWFYTEDRWKNCEEII